ncbi:TRAP transporter substrate-binding protein [Brevibacillus marinus]|uniref:TRAP transporter substrate-binding protein n=1 Tax=Brevibacillus marinus TaxID=2496837 RepID=UPI0013DF3554|nr:TRAP transporter substrate-binding protein [Brevibacillus marinus]
MIKKLFTSALILSMTALALTGCGSGGGSAEGTASNEGAKEAETYTMKFAHVSAPDSHYHAGAEKFKEIVEKNSNGRIRVEIYPSGQLGGEKDLAESLKSNIVQAAIIAGTLPIIEPKFAVLDLPYLFDNYDDAHEKLSGELGEKLFSLLPEKGLKGISWTENGFRVITNSKKPIRTPDDLKGLKIRVPENQAYVATFEALGANPTPIAFPDLFSSLEQKVVDGQENPLPQIYSNKFHEVQDYLSVTHHLYGPAPIIMSLKFYESLPDDLKKVIDEAGIETQQYQWEVVQNMEKEIMEDLKTKGITIVEDVDVEKFKELTRPVYDEFEEIVGKELMDLARN